MLRTGLVLVDTPGIGGIGSAAAVVTASSLRTAHAALFVTDASQELTRPELTALADAVDRCGNVALVVTKTDLYPAWRDIVAADREHLAARGLKVPILTVSTALRRRALADQDREVNAESGYPELVRLLRDELATDGRRLVRRGCHRSVHRIARVLAMPLRHEHDRLESASDEEIDAALTDARRRGAEFTERAKKWQQIMSDGLTDLIAEADADLRGRLRAIVRDAESLLDENEPDAVWDEFEPDLYRRTAEALDGTQRSSGERAQQAFRAGYGGAMPIMMVGGMALGVLGLGTLVMPLAGAAGLLAGRKALKDDHDKQLQQRRQQAKAAVKRYIDDTTFRAANERKQAQRDLQRSLRDHFTARVRELARVHDREIEAVKSAAASSQEERRARAGEVRAELDRLRAVVQRADAALAASDTSQGEPASEGEPASQQGARSPEAAHG
ncbi:MAG: dynamin family protein [Ilumatobacteraceae bacterium]